MLYLFVDLFQVCLQIETKDSILHWPSREAMGMRETVSERRAQLSSMSRSILGEYIVDLLGDVGRIGSILQGFSNDLKEEKHKQFNIKITRFLLPLIVLSTVNLEPKLH